MQIDIDNKIGQKGAWAEGVRNGNEILKMVLGQSADSVKGKWELKQDERDRPFLALTLSDSTGQVVGRFTAEELENSERLWYRLNRLWGDLLQERSRKLLEELMKAEPVGKEV